MPENQSNIDQEVAQALIEEVHFEEPLEPTDSPLNQPVVQNEIGHSEAKKEEAKTTERTEPLDFSPNPEDKVPEQDIGKSQSKSEQPEEKVEIPDSHAKVAADTILGITDNVLAVGGGFFVRIKKHKDFYEFEEIIQVIDEQNQKNVKRLQLDKEDKQLLRPLLIAIIKKKSKELTPEQQLLGAVLSILMKKGQMVMEMRMENEVLVERILEIIKAEKKADPGPEEEEIKQAASQPEPAEMDIQPAETEAQPLESSTELAEIIEVIEEPIKPQGNEE